MIRLGLIGVGYWGPNYARILAELPEAELIWACDLNPRALDIIRLRYHDVGLTMRLEDVLSDPAVDAVIISTPTSTHAALSLAALEAGKHVLCEKPLASRTEECDELVDAASRMGSVLMVGHTFVFNPAVKRLRALVQAGELGRVLYCHAERTALGPIREDVNALWDLAPHDVSMLLYLIDEEATQVAAHGESYVREGTEDVVFLTLRLGHGVLANIHLSWLDPYKVRRMTLIGDRRMIVFDDVAHDEKIRIFDKGASYERPAAEARGTEYGEYTAVVRDGDITIPKIPWTEPLKEQVVHFLHCCTEGLQPDADGVAARRVVSVLEAASESLRQRGAPIDVRWLASSRT